MNTLRVITVLVSIVFLVSAQASLADINSDLVCHWTFDEDFTDSAGATANDAAGYGDAAVTTTAGQWVVGGGALKLDGVGDYLNVADQAEVDGNGSGGVTFSSFIYLNAMPAEGTNADIFSKAYNEQYRFGVNVNSNLWYLIEDGVGRDVQEIDTGLVVGRWYHVAMTADFTTSTVRFYVDGSEVGTGLTTAMTQIRDRYHPLKIGTWNANQADGFFNGYIDDLRIYHRVLGGSDVAELAGVPEPGSLTLLVLGFLGLLGVRCRR